MDTCLECFLKPCTQTSENSSKFLIGWPTPGVTLKHVVPAPPLRSHMQFPQDLSRIEGHKHQEFAMVAFLTIDHSVPSKVSLRFAFSLLLDPSSFFRNYFLLILYFSSSNKLSPRFLFSLLNSSFKMKRN